jgi:simple sugar transport system permease protein
MDDLTAFLESTVRTATPLALAAIGELVVERAGVINIGLEGMILAGAFGALVGAGIGGTTLGFVAAMLAGVACALLLALFVVRLRADQIITGTAVTLLAVGLTGTMYQVLYGESGAALTIPTSGSAALPLIAAVPVVGPAFFAQPPITYLVYVAFPLLWWWLYRTRPGLALRAIGERPEAAEAAGVRTGRTRVIAILFGGAMGGLSGATLVLAQAGTFAEGMSAGRGFIAIAVVVLGRWHPVGTAFAALLFGAASALQFFFQAMGWPVPYQLPLALPYLLTLAALAGAGRTLRARRSPGRGPGSGSAGGDAAGAEPGRTGWAHAPAALGQG